MKTLVHAALLLFGSAVLAQSPVVTSESAPAQAPDKLAQMEATYRESLKTRHQPIIQQYLTELRTAQARALTMEEKSAYAAEMARVAKIVTDGGVVTPRVSEPTPAPVTPANAPMGRGIVFSLDPHEAVPAQPEGAETVPLGTASWTLSKLQPGTYELVAEYSCPTVPEGGSVKVEFAGLTETRPLRATHATKDAATVRLLRIGRLVLPQEVVGAQMVVTATPSDTAWFSVRRILLARAEKKPEN